MPGAIVRRGAYIAPGAVLMPSFVNIGARVGEGTMVDTWATVGSCAQIGRNVHISGGAGIGGVLEPLQAGPVIIEDNCFIGARSEVAEGVVVEEGAVLSMGVFLGASTKIVDRATGEVIYGRVPAYSVVVPGTLPSDKGGPALACAVIVKRVDERTRSKTIDQRAAARLSYKPGLSLSSAAFVGSRERVAPTCHKAGGVPPWPRSATDLFDRKARDAAPPARRYAAADDQQRHEPPRLGHPARPGADLGRRLPVHRASPCAMSTR